MRTPGAPIPKPAAGRRAPTRTGRRWEARFGIRVVALAALVAAGCGKKGPPLAPLVHIPAAVDKIAAARVGADVYVTLTVPAENIDKSKPADIRRIDVYAVTTATPPAAGQFLAQASRIAEVPVAPPPPPDGSAPSPSDAAIGPAQGMAVTVRDTLTPEQLRPQPPLPPPPGRARAVAPATTTPLASAPPAGPPMPRRFYMAIAFSDRSRSGPQGAVADLPLPVIPPPPDAFRSTYSSTNVALSWQPSGGLIGYLLDRTLAPESPPFDELAVTTPPAALASDVPAGPTRYNVYRNEGLDPLTLPPLKQPPSWQAARPMPLNPAPLDALEFSDLVDFARTQCYEVRAVRGAAGAWVEGDATPPECVTAVDTFPPAPPANVTAVATEGSIALIWEPNAELDLGGYIVLRGDAGSATLQPLMDRAIVEPRFTDRTVKAGQRYVYAVVAVDDRVPVPNMSGESARVEETAK